MVGLQQGGHQLVHAFLGRWWEMSLHRQLAHGLAQTAFDQVDPTLPALFELWDALQHGAVEVETGLHQGVGQIGRQRRE